MQAIPNYIERVQGFRTSRRSTQDMIQYLTSKTPKGFPLKPSSKSLTGRCSFQSSLQRRMQVMWVVATCSTGIQNKHNFSRQGEHSELDASKSEIRTSTDTEAHSSLMCAGWHLFFPGACAHRLQSKSFETAL